MAPGPRLIGRRPILAVIGAAVVIGAFSWWVDQLSWMGIREGSPEYAAFGALKALGNMPTLWLIAAFVVGAVVRRPLAGAAFGTVALMLAVAIYYGFISLTASRAGVNLIPATVVWAAVAVVAGPIMGGAGGAWASTVGWQRWASAGLLGGALLAMGLFAFPASGIVGVGHAVAGIAAGASAGPRLSTRGAGIAVALAVGAAGFVANAAVFSVVRQLL